MPANLTPRKTAPQVVGPSGELVIKTQASKSKRWCGIEQQNGVKSLAVRKGGPAGEVERRVLMSSVDQVLEVNRNGEAQFVLAGSGGPGVGAFQLTFTAKQPEELFKWIEGLRYLVKEYAPAATAPSPAKAAAEPSSGKATITHVGQKLTAMLGEPSSEKLETSSGKEAPTPAPAAEGTPAPKQPSPSSRSKRGSVKAVKATVPTELTVTLTGCAKGGMGLGLNSANVITAMLPKTPAAKAGAKGKLKLGDKVVSLDGEPLHGREVKDVVQPNDKHTLVLLRGGAAAAPPAAAPAGAALAGVAAKLDELLGAGALEKLELVMRRVDGSFGVQLSHYNVVCNIVNAARQTDCPLQVDDLIVAIGEVSIVGEKIDAHLPSGDMAAVTVLRPKPGTLQELLMTLRGTLRSSADTEPAAAAPAAAAPAAAAPAAAAPAAAAPAAAAPAATAPAAPAGEVEPSQAAPPEGLLSGDRVEVFGLTSEAGQGLNGQRGAVVAWRADKARWEVQLDSQPLGKTVNAKHENLRKLPRGSEEQEAAAAKLAADAEAQGGGAAKAGSQAQEEAASASAPAEAAAEPPDPTESSDATLAVTETEAVTEAEEAAAEGPEEAVAEEAAAAAAEEEKSSEPPPAEEDETLRRAQTLRRGSAAMTHISVTWDDVDVDDDDDEEEEEEEEEATQPAEPEQEADTADSAVAAAAAAAAAAAEAEAVDAAAKEAAEASKEATRASMAAAALVADAEAEEQAAEEEAAAVAADEAAAAAAAASSRAAEAAKKQETAKASAAAAREKAAAAAERAAAAAATAKAAAAAAQGAEVATAAGARQRAISNVRGRERTATFSHSVVATIPAGFAAGDVFPVDLEDETIYVMIPETCLATEGDQIEIEVHHGLAKEGSFEVDLSTWGVVVG